MDGKVLKKQIAKLIEKNGPESIQLALVKAGLGLSTVQKIIKGEYEPGPKTKRAMATLLENENAS